MSAFRAKKKTILMTGALCAATLYMLSACDRLTGNDKVLRAAKGNPDMIEAVRQARSTLDTFLVLADQRPAGTEAFKLKVALQDGDTAEYSWVAPFNVTVDGFEGTLTDDPEKVKTFKAGQRIHFKRADVADWGYRKDGHQVGSYTMCAAIKKMSKEEADFYRNNSGFDC